ncbi:MAG: hypothetical protein ACRDTQ_20395 [Micromonosporaceae bacterium]
MSTADIVWGILILAGLGYELFTLRNVERGDTLTETVRRWARTHTTPGRLVFLAAWLGFAIWFAGHIVGAWP